MCFIKTRKPEASQCFRTQDTNGQNSVSLRQGNWKQFNVSVLRISMDKTVFHRKGNWKQFNVSVLEIPMETF